MKNWITRSKTGLFQKFRKNILITNGSISNSLSNLRASPSEQNISGFLLFFSLNFFHTKLELQNIYIYIIYITLLRFSSIDKITVSFKICENLIIHPIYFQVDIKLTYWVFFIGFLVHSIWLISRIYSNGWHSKDFLSSLWCPNKNVEFFRMLVCRRTVVQDTGYTHDEHYNLNCLELSCHISSFLWIWLDSLPLKLLIRSVR